MKEVEILVKVNCDKETAMQALSGLEYKGEKETIDIYYNESGSKDIPKEWFRLRLKDGKAYMTYKKDIFKEEEWLYSDEEEVVVEDFEKAQRIIEGIGMKELVTVDNRKHTFTDDKYEVVLEDVKDLGLFLEVERLNLEDDADIETVKKEIQEFIDSLGIDVSKDLNVGKPELMLQR